MMVSDHVQMKGAGSFLSLPLFILLSSVHSSLAHDQYSEAERLSAFR